MYSEKINFSTAMYIFQFFKNGKSVDPIFYQKLFNMKLYLTQKKFIQYVKNGVRFAFPLKYNHIFREFFCI